MQAVWPWSSSVTEYLHGAQRDLPVGLDWSPVLVEWTCLTYDRIVFVFGNPLKVPYTRLLNDHLLLKCMCDLPSKATGKVRLKCLFIIYSLSKNPI